DKLRSKEDSAYKSLRRTEVFIDTKSGITMEINSYTDPVRTDFTPSHPELNTLKTTGKITGNESLSAYRSAVLLKTLQEELNLLAGTYLSREKAKVVIDHLNKAFVKAKISIGMYSVPFSEFYFYDNKFISACFTSYIISSFSIRDVIINTVLRLSLVIICT